jgi:1-acyl-sn-glycerol-3-phosphate acyltransferase
MSENGQTPRTRKRTTARKSTRRVRQAANLELPLNGQSERSLEKPRRKKRAAAAKAGSVSARPPEPELEEGEPDLITEPLAADTSSEADVPDASLRKQLTKEIDELIERLRRLNPGYNPPPFSPQRLLQLLEEGAEQVSPGLRLGILEKLRGAIGEDLFDADTWKGMWYVLNNSLQYQADILKRRVTGEYETDKWGLDREYLDAVKPFADFMYKTYWRVELSGLENVPESGRALLVVNHSGQLPWDGAMLATGIINHHPAQRLVRTLYATWFPTLPFISDFLTKCGQVLATEDNGIRLLEDEELVAVYPEGYKGVGKLFKDRYKLARFGRGGFVRMALKTGAPMIPAAVIGAEETYISLYKSNFMAKLTGFPYFPISPTFPWLGLLGFVPLPTKWYIDIGEPIPTHKHGPNAANNMMLVSQLTDQTRNVVQEMILKRLAQRRSVFLG